MKNLLFSLFLLMSFQVFGQTIMLDKAHARLQFYATHLTISSVDGKFTDFDVHVKDFDATDLLKAKFHVLANLNSVDTGIEARDTHLKSADFFDVAKNKNLEFTSTKVTKIKGNAYALSGNLTLNNITKPVNLKLVYNGKVNNSMNKKNTHGFTIEGKLNRLDFGIGNNFPEAVVGNQINIVSNLEFVEN
ncbi:YceI family protein [Vaginella massiliensis]|uniref:YceI family protein n=1 Tax=Vaginella massiliensis TaxID=1816680 RepID=UPI0037504D7B